MKKLRAFGRACVMVLAVVVLRRATDTQSDAEKVAWWLMNMGPNVAVGLAFAGYHLTLNYEESSKRQEQFNLSIAQDVAFRVARRIVDATASMQANDDYFFHVQRRMFELVSMRGMVRLKGDGYEYLDYDAGGVPCRMITSKRLMPYAKIALGMHDTPVSARDRNRARGLRWILQHHGGGYTSGTVVSGLDPGHHMGVHSQERDIPFDLVVIIVDYALAPEKVFPAAVVDGVRCFEWHVSSPYISPKQVVLAGESAGGGLVAATFLALQDKSKLDEFTSEHQKEKDHGLPAALLLMSPFIDVGHQSTFCPLRANTDIITAHALQVNGKAYCPNATVATTSQLASPILSDMKGTPPLFVTAGGNEILYPKIRKFAETAMKSNPGQDVMFEAYVGMPHSFQLEWGSLDCLSCKDLYNKTLDFVYKHTEVPPSEKIPVLEESCDD